MPDKSALYEQEAILNTAALLAYSTDYPQFQVGDTFIDTNSATWVIDYIQAYNGSVRILARWVDGTPQDKWGTFYPPMMRGMFEVFNSVTVLTTETAPHDFILDPSTQYGLPISANIDGLPLNPATEYDWNPDTYVFRLLINSTAGQVLNFEYKKRPFYNIP